MKTLKIKDQVEICELYSDRFAVIEIAQVYDVSTYQVQSVLQKYNVHIRTDEERL